MREPPYIPSKKELHQRYTLKDGTVVPSTTEITSLLGGKKLDNIAGWQKKLMKKGIDPDRQLTYYADLGTYAHALVEEYINEKLGNKDFKAIDPYEYSQEIIDNAQNGLESFLVWEKNHNVKYDFSEIQLVSEEYRYGGTIDLGAIVDGVPMLIDLKTSSNIYDTHRIQIAAYWNMYKENKEEERETAILKIGKTRVEHLFHTVHEKDLKRDFNTFWHLRHIYDNINRM